MPLTTPNATTGRSADLMQPLPPSDCEKLLDLIAELYSVRESGNLPQQFLRALQRIIPHEFGGCHLIEPSRHHIAACYEPERSPLPAQHKEFWRLAGQHPLNPVLFEQPSRAWKLSDVMSRQAFHATEFYKLLYRPLQVDCELVAALPEGGERDEGRSERASSERADGKGGRPSPLRPLPSHLGSGAFFLISLHRCRRDFTERDRTVLNLLLPHVADVRRRIRANAQQAANGHAQGNSAFPAEGDAFREWLRWRTPWGLTQRECDVLFWLCQGKTNAEIGRILGIAERTAETHALHIYPKMGVENRYTAIATLNRLTSLERQ